MLAWVDNCEDNTAEDPSRAVSSSEQTQLTAASLAEALSLVQVPSSSGPQISTAVISSGTGPQPLVPMPGGSSRGENIQNSVPMSSGGQLPPIMSTCARGATTVQTSAVITGSSSHASYPPTGWVVGTGNVYSSTNIELGLHHMNAVGAEINSDLEAAEQEVLAAAGFFTDSGATDLLEICRSIEEKVDGRYRDAASKLARMDLGRSTNVMKIMEDNIAGYKGKLRQILSDVRRARSVGAPSVTDVAGIQPTEGTSVTQSSRSYKPSDVATC